MFKNSHHLKPQEDPDLPLPKNIGFGTKVNQAFIFEAEIAKQEDY